MLADAVQLGLLLGLRHASDADHVCTVASLLRAGQGRRLLTSAGDDGDVLLWSLNEGVKATGMAPMGASVVKLCFSPDDAFLAAADAEGRVRVWSPAREARR